MSDEQQPPAPPQGSWPPPAPQQYPPPYSGQPPPYPPPYQPPYPGQAYPGQAYPGQAYPGQAYPYAQQGYPPPYPPPPYPGYSAKPPKPAFPHDRPRQYHHMLRTWDYAPWRSAVGIIVVIIGFIVIAPVVALPVLFIGLAIEGGDIMDNLESFGTLEKITPSSMLYLNVTLGLAILVTWVVIRLLHGMRPRWLSSVAPKLRWGFLMACLGVSVGALVASFIVGAIVPGTPADQELTGKLNEFTPTAAWIALIVLLTTPFQAAGEEYVFRGYLLQAIGSFVERTWWKWGAIIITSLLFAMAHGLQNFPLFFDRFMFGFIAGWLAIRTGGLEAGIALHVLNNYLAFGFALAFGDISESLGVSEVSWWNIPVTLTQAGVYALLVVLVARKMAVKNETSPPVSAPVPVAAGPFWSHP